MKILNIIDEDVVNYKKTNMYIAFPFCTMKCNIDAGKEICQNSKLQNESVLTVDGDKLIQRYLSNPLSKAFVLGGLEPFDSYFDLISFVSAVRDKYSCNDDIVIYTGYTEEELLGKALFEYSESSRRDTQTIIKNVYAELLKYDNIIIKFGRYMEGNKPHFDETLGVYLASDNQYAKVIK